MPLHEDERETFAGLSAGHRTLVKVVQADLFVREQQRVVDGDHFFERLGEGLDGRIVLLDELAELLFSIASGGGISERFEDTLRGSPRGGGVCRQAAICSCSSYICLDVSVVAHGLIGGKLSEG